MPRLREWQHYSLATSSLHHGWGLAASPGTCRTIGRRKPKGTEFKHEGSEPAGSHDHLKPRFYHGTKADLKPGDLIRPGRSPNFGELDR